MKIRNQITQYPDVRLDEIPNGVAFQGEILGQAPQLYIRLGTGEQNFLYRPVDECLIEVSGSFLVMQYRPTRVELTIHPLKQDN
jgi:hypothetical protein